MIGTSVKLRQARKCRRISGRKFTSLPSGGIYEMWSSSSVSLAARYGRLVASQIRHQKKDSASLFGGAGAVLAIAGAASTSGERARVSHAVTTRAYNTGASLIQQNGANRFGSTAHHQIGRAAGRYKSSNAAATSETTAAAASPKTGFVAWYESHLEAAPVRTKAVTGMILWGLGDIVAQLVPHFVFDEKKDSDKNSDNASTAKPFVYDYARTGRAALFGFAIHAPLSHVHYNFLEWMTVRAGFQGLSVPVFKTVMEQFVYWSWFSNSLYHGAMGALQGWTWEQCYDRIADVLWDTQKAQWVFWIPVQLINFNFVPVRHQLNVVLTVSVVWTALLSAWYPPEEEKSEAVKAIDDKKKAD